MIETSITIRPPLLDFRKISDFSQLQFLKDMSEYYVISKEKGSCVEHSHYQIVLKLKTDTRSDSLNRTIRRKLEKILGKDTIDWKIALKIKEIKSNFEGVVGYTLKEEGRETELKLPKEEQYYTELYRNVKVSKSRHLINRNNYHIRVEIWINDNKKLVNSLYKKTTHYKQQKMNYGLMYEPELYYSDELIKTILDNMVYEGYYLTFLTGRNIQRVVDYIQCYLTKEGSMSSKLELENERFT